MRFMDDSMAHSGEALASFELPGWKTWVSWTAAVLISALFLIAGVWKITDAPGAAVRLAQAKVPQELSLLAALGLGIVETFAAVLVLVPRFRRWGAWIIGALLVVFMIYIGVFYDQLRGEECSCFPWLKRAVGPGFFVGDGVMLGLAALAGVWSKRSTNLRSASLILGAVVVFALVSYGVAATRNVGLKAPDEIAVDGKPFSLQEGKIFIYFYNPECLHCLDAGKRMAKLDWGDTKLISVPVEQPQFAAYFMKQTELPGFISTDAAKLREVFKFTSTPAGVALQDGHQVAALTMFDGDEPEATLRKLGYAK
jgi:uncharacterized membrane protein YphA (DoxX/SURF4 family)